MKSRKVQVELIDPAAKPVTKGDPYAVLARLVIDHHPDLIGAKIALVWHKGWKADEEGHVRLAKPKKASDLDREFHDYDLVVLLNRNVWNQVDFSEKQIRALLDHQLAHFAVVYDKEGDRQEDDRGRTMYRIVKHDVEEFTAIIERHGCWKRDLDAFVKSALAKPSLFPESPSDPPADPPAAPADASGGFVLGHHGDPATSAVANDPKFLRAAARLCPDGKNLMEVTLSGAGVGSATLTRETGKRIRRLLKKTPRKAR